MDTEYLTPKEVADRLRVTDQAVYKWLKEGRLDGYKFGRAVRVSRKSVEQFVESSRTGPEKGKAAA